MLTDSKFLTGVIILLLFITTPISGMLEKTSTSNITISNADIVQQMALIHINIPKPPTPSLQFPVIFDADITQQVVLASVNISKPPTPSSHMPVIFKADLIQQMEFTPPSFVPTPTPTPTPSPTPTPTPTPSPSPTPTPTPSPTPARIITIAVTPDTLNISESVTISGAIIPAYSTIVTITFKSPSGKIIEQPVMSTISGSYSLTFSPNEVGEWNVNASCVIEGEKIKSETVSFTVKQYHIEVGYAILIVGRNDDWLSQEYIDLTANMTYETLLKRGFTDERIFYLNPRNFEKVDMLTSKENVSYAINTWAEEKVGTDVPLFIYMIDHGKEDTFLLKGLSETLNSSELDSYLDELTADTGCHKITIVVESCSSGSFIRNLSAPGRIIVTSTSEKANALIEKTGATFSKYFFNAIAKGESIKEAFEEASNAPEIKSYSDMLKRVGLPPQIPLLDDNGDGIGHPAPVCCGDGSLSSSTYIGTQFGALDFPPTILDSIDNQTVIVGEEIEIWAIVVDDFEVKRVYATIIDPDFAIDRIRNDTMYEINLTTLELKEEAGNKYTASFIPKKEGRYVFIIHAFDEEGNIATPREIIIVATEGKFDTGPGTYPSIMGIHRGTIIPSYNITVKRVYTYSCPGTGGHSEEVAFYENGKLIAKGTWNGYHSDHHYITISPPVMLLKGHKYNYTIKTGSYPQIIHKQIANVTGGIITCSEFIDANGRKYTDWIPAIRLE